MSWVAVAVGGSALVGAGASLFAADKQSDAAANALAFQKSEAEKQQKNFAPYLGIGQQATGKLGDLMSGKMDGFFTSPDYQFRFGEGQRALDNSAAAKGGLLSGNALRATTAFGQNLASSEFSNYWNRMFDAARLGQSTAVGGAAAGSQMAGQIGNTMQGLGAAQASGAVGAANALTGGAQNFLFYNAMQNRPGSVYSGSLPVAQAPTASGNFHPGLY